MADEVVIESDDQDVVVLESEEPEYLLYEGIPVDEVVVTYANNEVAIIERDFGNEILFTDQPRDYVVHEQGPGQDVIVSKSEGPPGPPGPAGLDGPPGPMGKHVVDIEISGSDLITTMSDGSQINAGELPSNPSQEFNFATPSTLWVCEHSFGRRAIQVVSHDSSGVEIFGDVTYVNDNVVEIRWYSPNSGSVRITK